MSIETVDVQFDVALVTNQLPDGAVARVRLSSYDLDGTTIVSSRQVEGIASGGRVLIGLWPNERGVNGTHYDASITHEGVSLWSGRIVVPQAAPEEQPLSAAILVQRDPPPTVDEAQRVLLQVQQMAAIIAGPAGQAAEQANASAAAAAEDAAVANQAKGAAQGYANAAGTSAGQAAGHADTASTAAGQATAAAAATAQDRIATQAARDSAGELQVAAQLAANAADGDATATAADRVATEAAAALAQQYTGMRLYGSKAAMDADLAHPANTIARVVADPTPANVGDYYKIGASGAGSWQPASTDRVTQEATRAQAAEVLLQYQVDLTGDQLAPVRAAVLSTPGITRPDVCGGWRMAGGAWPMRFTTKGITEFMGVAVQLGSLREGTYMPRDVLAPWIVEIYEKAPDGSHRRVKAFRAFSVQRDGTLDFAPSDNVRKKLGGSLAPPAGMFAIAATAAPALQYAVYGSVRYAWNAVAGSSTAIVIGTGVLRGVPAYGQSNSGPGGLANEPLGTRVATAGVVDRHRALMLSTGLNGTEGTAVNSAAISDLVPAAEDDVVGETGGTSFMRSALAADDAIGLHAGAYAYRVAGQAGQSITVLKKGGVPFANLVASVTRLAEIAQAYGLRCEVPTVLWRHGEADAGSMTQATYYGHLLQLHADLVRDLQAITRQRAPVWLLQSILVAPDGASRNITPITFAQMQALDAGLTIAASCSPYWFHSDFAFGLTQTVHWTPKGKAHLVEFEARAMRIISEAMAQSPGARLGDLIQRWVYSGGAWSLARVPFEPAPRTLPATVVRTGNVIEGTVAYAEGGLSIYTGERGPAVNSGFAWVPTTGSSAISAVTIVDAGPINARWRVTLTAADSGGTLTYAATEQDATTDGGPDAWGDLFDGCTEPSLAIPGRTLRQGLLPFSIAVA